MSKYRITLDGKTYEMEVELLSDNGAVQPAAKKEYKEVKAAPKDADVKTVNPSVQKKTVNGSGTVTAPMPGTVLKVEKNVGDTVNAGELVLILEAMKMENEIAAPASGTIAVMNCTPGKTVAGGDILFEVK